MNSAVERAIKFMFERYSEPLSLADVAESAILSRFHFCRTFRDATGVTPGRFLSAIRIYQAKRMLVNTTMNVTDIAFAVGYNSLGSFSNHFTDSVGISPGRFRHIPPDGGIRPSRPAPSSPGATVTGTVQLGTGYTGARVYLGAFDTPIVQRRPACSVIVEAAGTKPVPFQLRDVAAGTWFVQAVAVADNTDPEPWTRRTLLVAGSGPVTVAGDTDLSDAIELRPRKPTDLPILLALTDLELEAPGDLLVPRQAEEDQAALAVR
jgi:AraC family transcriptional regulator